MKRLTLIILFSLPALAVLAAGLTNGVERGIVEVLVTAQRPDPRIPWRTEKPSLRSSYGVVIAPGRVVTTEDTVRNATLVEIRRPGQPAKITARIVKTDPRINAALLAVPEEAAAQFSSIAWDGNTTRNTTVTLAQFDDAAAGEPEGGRSGPPPARARPPPRGQTPRRGKRARRKAPDRRDRSG